MSAITGTPLVLKDVILTIDGDTYETLVSQAVFTPKSSTITFQGLTPEAAFSDTTLATWTCQLTYAQDWDTSGSLGEFLYANEGDTVAASLKPKSGSGPSFTANLSITPGAIGGTVNAYATTSVTLGSDRPVLVPAV